MRERDKVIDSIGALLSNLKSDTNGYDDPVWYRGHSVKHWSLVPSLHRDPKRINIDYLSKFKQNAIMLLNPRPTNAWEWLFIMRHYDVPTRLLDWTESPLIAAYFAVTDRPKADGAIWLLRPTKLNTSGQRQMDCELPPTEDGIVGLYRPDIKLSDGAPLRPVAFIATRNTPRMQSQLSVFTISHTVKTPLEKFSYADDYLQKYIIPKESKQTIKDELDLLKINKFHLYPELESIGKELCEYKI